MHKNFLQHKLKLKLGFREKDTKLILDTVLQTIKEIVDKENELKLKGFGTFKKVCVKKTIRRNPKTGEKIQVPARVKIKFVSSLIKEEEW